MCKNDEVPKCTKMWKIEIAINSCVFVDDLEPFGGPRSQKTHKFLLFFNDLEFAPGFRRCGVRKCSSDPTYTRRGPG